ncbi:MAG: 4Fe-4S dicluster domain-containing protein [Campylobacteraceae bacterium]|nr:4Fe-4S dicluster domain-containing protein [Campylobacteraceae bacterium]
MKLFDMTKKYGQATYKYPFEPYEIFEGFRGKPNYVYEKCIGCTACGNACPSNAINVKMNQDKTKLVWEFNCGRCIFCGRCDEVCPTGAVMLSEQFENAVKFDKDNLKENGELDLEKCEVCDKVFTTKRLIAYDLQRLKGVGWSDEVLKQKAQFIKTCPDCKRKKSVEFISKGFKNE